MSKYNIQYVSQKAIKRNVIAEFLADRTVKEYELMKFEFLDKDLMVIFQIEDESTKEDSWKLYFDGAFNALGHGTDAILISLEEKYCLFTIGLDFDCTNNMAEYEACNMGLQATMDKKMKNLKMFGNSALVIYQLRGDWLTQDSKLILYHKLVMEMVDYFEEINFNLLPCKEN